MAYGKKYTAGFYDWRFGNEFRVDISELDFTGATSEMLLGASPVKLRKAGNGDPFKPMQPTEATITIQLIPDGNTYSEFFTNNEKKFLIEVRLIVIESVQEPIAWTGYLLPGQTVSGFNAYRTISITARDGLSQLKANTYLDPTTGFPYEDYERMVVQIAQALDYIGLDLHICNSINLLPEEYNDSPSTSDDALYLVSTQQRRFQNALLKSSSCWTVIEEILRSFGAQIFQAFGEWWIMRYAERFDDEIPYREFTEAGALVGPDTLSTQVDLGGATDDPLCVPIQGFTYRNEPGVKTVTTIQDFGLRESLFPGYNFPPNEFDADTEWARHYSKSASSNWAKYSVGDGYVVRCNTASADTTQYFQTDPITMIEGNGNITYCLRLKGGAGSNVNLQVVICFDAGGGNWYYWQPTGSPWTLHSGEPDEDEAFGVWFVSQDVDAPMTVDVTKDFLIGSFPATYGDFKIKFYDADGYPFISEILLTPVFGGDWEFDWFTEVDTSLIDADNPNKLEPIRMLFTGLSGIDNDFAFSDGIMVMEDLESYPVSTNYWAMRTAGTSNVYRLRKWLAQNHVDNDKLLSFRGTIITELPWFYKSIKVSELDDKIFVPDDVVWDLKHSTISGTWIEVKDQTEVIDLTPSSIDPISVDEIQTGEENSVYNTSGFVINPDPFRDYRSGTESLASGNQTISFSSPFATGTTYQLFIKIVAGDGYTIGGEITSEGISGFDIEIDESGATLTYLAIKTL